MVHQECALRDTQRVMDQDRYLALLEAMKDIPKDRRSARLQALWLSMKVPPELVEGSCEGQIVDSPEGENGHYDPVFRPEGRDSTMAS